jgi:hypothetical protein
MCVTINTYMTKKRTKKDKLNVKHPFLIRWENSAQSETSKANVNRQFENLNTNKLPNSKTVKNADTMAKDEVNTRFKKNIVKSLGLVSLILALELVIYSFWH